VRQFSELAVSELIEIALLIETPFADKRQRFAQQLDRRFHFGMLLG
jgi:hypothetical protein